MASKAKIVAYAFIIFLIGLTGYALVEGVLTDSAGFGGLGYSVGSTFLSIPIAFANDITGAITAFGKMIEHYLNPINW